MPEGLSIMPRPTVAASYPKTFLDFAVSKGADQGELLRRSGIRADDLADPNNRVSVESYAALVDAGIDLTGDPALALHFGEEVRIETVTIVGLIAVASETIGGAFEQLNRYSKLMFDDDDIAGPNFLSLLRDDEGLWLTNSSKVYDKHPRLAEITFALFTCGAQRYWGKSETAVDGEIHFIHEAPSYRAEYHRLFGQNIVFGSARNASRVPDEFLSIKLPTSNRYVFGLMSERAEKLLAELECSKTTRGEVERLLMLMLHTGESGVDRIAQKMGVSRKTLYRRLKSEGATYEQLLDELRHKLALSFLADKKVSVNETAYLVGFSDPAAFSRAFKRWTGGSPSAAGSRKTDA